MKTAIYARYSDDRQREASIDDQVRVCTLFAQHQNLNVFKVYSDKAISGVTRARPAYLTMLDDASAGLFQTLIVHDLSRLSRDDYELKGVLRKFAWQELRVIGVSDGYDSTRQGHKIHAGFKGLMNEMLIDDIRAWTHKAMAGKAKKGYNCGGRVYGYRNVPIEHPTRRDPYGRPEIEHVKFEIDESQAVTVRAIHGWYADGFSYKWIASELNRLGVAASRGGSWAVSAIKVILENETYEGRLCWNRRQWIRHPETGKRTYRERPQSEWIITEIPALRIVSAGVIDAVRARQRRNMKEYGPRFVPASAHRYLFSGLMRCAECGGAFVIASRGKYACAANKRRGPAICSNGLTVSRYIVEDRILAHIKQLLQAPGNQDKFKNEVAAILVERNAKTTEHVTAQRLKGAERVRDNLLSAIKQGIITASTKDALEAAEAEVLELKRRAARARESELPYVLPLALERYRDAVMFLEDRLSDEFDRSRDILKSLFGAPLRVHRKGEHLEVELPSYVPALLAKALNSEVDLRGCGGRICNESTFISLEARRLDSTPLKHRKHLRT